LKKKVVKGGKVVVGVVENGGRERVWGRGYLYQTRRRARWEITR
jgi:hypothetical protein